MVHDSMKNLQFDRRLRGRRGWVAGEAFEAHLEQLPDVADKGEVVGDDEPAPPAAEAQTPVVPPPAPAPGFSPTED